MIVNRTELFNYHSVFDVELDGVHHYIYNLPYYDNVYTGMHVFPDGDKFYVITPELYIDLITRKNKSRSNCQSYVEDNIDTYLIKNDCVTGFEYLGDRRDFLGSQQSALIQALVCKYSK